MVARNGLLLLALVAHAECLKPAEAPRSAVRRSIKPGLTPELKPSLVPRSGHDLVAAKTEVCLRCPNPIRTLGSIQPAATRTAQASESSVAVGVLAVLGGVLIHLACGSMYTWGNLISYVPPRLKYWDGVLPEGGGMPDASIVLPIIICAQMSGMPLGPLLEGRLGAQLTAVLGGAMMSAGVFFASYAASLKAFVWSYAVYLTLARALALALALTLARALTLTLAGALTLTLT